MADSRGLAGSSSDNTSSSGAGTITRIRLENFMCHSNLQIELCPWVNFITGQNGSGKSAILTALCVVFGCRAKGTQRAATLKDFIKTDCSYALVEVEMKNEGDDAFKREIFGDAIIIERRINESGSSTVIKDHRGRKVANRKEELREIIEHFNIDVENPCVVMSQDKSREFLHSGSEKDKFKFFYKATLLQQVDDLLQSIHEQLISANALVDELEALIKPIEKELAELQLKIKNMEELEELSQHVQLLKKKLAWSWVYDVDRQLQEQSATITKLKERIPICQVKIDSALNKMESLRDRLTKKKVQIECMTEKTSEVRRKQDELQHSISKATKEKLELEEEYGRYANQIQAMVKRVRLLEQQIQDVQEQNIKDTQAEERELEEKQKELQLLIDAANSKVLRLVEEESILSEMVSKATNEIRNINEEIEDYEKKEHDIRRAIRELQRHQTNKVTAFGGERVISLLRSIERHHQQFKMPPIGPIGAHVNLAKGDSWGPAVENAIGKLLNAFIVTEHRDALLLRKCAKEANYTNLQIIIYDFSRPRLNIPSHMLPQTKHPTALSLIRSDNNTVLNVLVDMGNAERQVLVEDYEVGKSVAFDRSISNVKEVYTLDGYKMFSRGSVQTVLPPRGNFRTSRLCSSYDNQIKNLELDASTIERGAEKSRKRKRDSEAHLNDLQVELRTLKARRTGADRDLASKRLALQDLKKSYAIETTSSAPSTINELHCEISKMQEEIREKEILMETLRVNIDEAEAKAEDLKLSFENLCESAREEINAFEKAEAEVMKIDQDLKSAEAETAHYQSVMTNKVLHDIEVAEAQYRELEENRKESGRKASIICPESDIEALGDWDRSTPEQLSAKLNKMNQRLQQESRRYSDYIDDLRLLYETKEKKISRKRHTYKSFREKLRACQDALDSRWSRFSQSRCYMKAELTRKFNGHLARKGVSGHCKVDYEKKTLTVEVKLPQDASRGNVRDTRGLSGGERSFSTLCFALALHQMIEAPFRAMDEFDVFMDAVSRKISLDTLVDFAVQQGSQWIFITPHDISLVKQGEKIKKQQMAAPRS